MDTLELSQKAAIEELRSRVQDVLKSQKLEDDRYLLRWLRARNFDVAKAEKMLKDSMKWREVFDIDNIAEYKIPQISNQYIPYARIGTDKEGCPVGLLRAGKTDIKGFIQMLKLVDIVKTIVWHLEDGIRAMSEESMQRGRHIEKLYIIFDMDGFSMKQAACRKVIETLQQLIQAYDKNYPEILKKVAVINASSIFYIAYHLVKPFISEATVQKICVFGRDKWKDALLQDIDPEVLPVHWGGTRTDGSGDPTCPNLVGTGGEIPKALRVSPIVKLNQVNGVTDVMVAARSTHVVQMEVTKPGSLLKWIFCTLCYDITYGVYHKTPKGLQEYLPNERVDSHMFVEEGAVECSQPGIYVLKFDNTGSYLRSKKLSYKIEVLPPSDLVEDKIVLNKINNLILA